ncbi:MAG: TPR end-of-group domain-containing protein [Paracoccaceae bacterium]
MPDDRAERRLAAILAADVVGYSRLMEANEEATMAALKAHRREVLDPVVAGHGGRIFKAMGDGFLVEFPSVVGAMRCAMEVQRAMPERNAGLPEDRHIRFRIGVNLGDLIVEGGDFYGDGVNIAARLEALARPGGILCSSVVREQVGNRLDAVFADEGEIALKNISQPVRAFSVSPPAAALPAPGAAARRDRPSVAVLPFANMSNDPEQEFFSDGITEDIITDLSNVSGLFVIGRNTVFAYKGKAVDLEETARKLGVAWLLEGSVRKAGNRVRITAQLIDGGTGGHVWAARYDRDLTDIFAVQDEITQAIVSELKVKLLPEEKAAIGQAPTGNVEAYTHYLKGMDFLRMEARLPLLRARQLFSRAIELDPGYARAFAARSYAGSLLESRHGEALAPGEVLADADRAVLLSPDLPAAHVARGRAMGAAARDDEAVRAYVRALELDPDNAEAHFEFGRFCTKLGRFEDSVAHHLRATEIQPEDCFAPLMLSQALYKVGRTDEVAPYVEIGIRRAYELLRRHPENTRPAQLIAPSLAYLGRREEALECLNRVLAAEPDDNQARYNAACTYAVLGEVDKAADLIGEWLTRVPRDARLWFLNDPDFDDVKDHPRFRPLFALASAAAVSPDLQAP